MHDGSLVMIRTTQLACSSTIAWNGEPEECIPLSCTTLPVLNFLLDEGLQGYDSAFNLFL